MAICDLLCAMVVIVPSVVLYGQPTTTTLPPNFVQASPVIHQPSKFQNQKKLQELHSAQATVVGHVIASRQPPSVTLHRLPHDPVPSHSLVPSSNSRKGFSLTTVVLGHVTFPSSFFVDPG